MPRVLEISLPEYDLNRAFDHDRLGERLDRLVIENFPEGQYADRAIGLQDHPGRTAAELVEVISRHGTDLYDPDRTSIFREDFSDYRYDIHAGAFDLRGGQFVFDADGLRSYFGHTLYDFQHKAVHDRGYSVRLNLILLYDRAALLPPLQVAEEKPWAAPFARYLYRFRPDVPDKGLRGIIVIG